MTEPTSTTGGVLALLIKLAPGLAGALVSLRFVPADISRSAKGMAAFTGFVASHYVGGALIEYFNVGPTSSTADAIRFTVGVFGMTALAHFMEQVAPLVATAGDRLRRMIGGGQ